MSDISEITIPSGNYLIKDSSARDIVAPEFSSSTAYAIGDYVIYEGALYKCTTAHSAGAWSSGDFTQTQVVDEVGGSGGHTIENASGIDLTQRDTMKFGGGLSASDDSTNEKTVITDEYEKIPWSTWTTYTPQEQEAHPNAIITGAPDTSSGGHIIEDASGTDLTQRDTLKFEGGLNASDDSTNEQTVVTDEYEEIPYSTWSGYTSEQKAAHPNAIITGAPDGGYELPTASASTLGGVKVGNGLYISNGVLSTKAKLVTTLTGTSQSTDYELVGELVVDTQSIYAINAIWSNGKPKGIGIGASSTSVIDIFKHDYDLDKEHVLGDVILLPQGTYKIYEKLINSGGSQVISIYRISVC